MGEEEEDLDEEDEVSAESEGLIIKLEPLLISEDKSGGKHFEQSQPVVSLSFNSKSAVSV